jgi:hypothetical protein
LVSTIALKAQKVEMAPDLSKYMVSIPEGGLISRPPESKQSPFPIKEKWVFEVLLPE